MKWKPGLVILHFQENGVIPWLEENGGVNYSIVKSQLQFRRCNIRWVFELGLEWDVNQSYVVYGMFHTDVNEHGRFAHMG